MPPSSLAGRRGRGTCLPASRSSGHAGAMPHRFPGSVRYCAGRRMCRVPWPDRRWAWPCISVEPLVTWPEQSAPIVPTALLAGTLYLSRRFRESSYLPTRLDLLPLPAGDEHAVAIQVRRPDRHGRSAANSAPVELDVRENQRLEIGLAGVEHLHRLGRLRLGQGADGEDQVAARFHARRDVGQQLPLNHRKLQHVILGGGPACVRIALPNADATARRIYEHAVELRSDRRVWPPSHAAER